MSFLTIDELIRKLELAPHPEGGWYRETYRADETIAAEALPGRFTGARSCSTAILFLLAQGEKSALHRIKSDELWHFHCGASLMIHMITPDGAYRCLRLGGDIMGGEVFQAVVPAGCWFGAECSGRGGYALVGCTVAPGFDFSDFEMGCRDTLLEQFPAHGEIIRRLTGIRNRGGRA
jgi:predicted cupin superfamily sugar epimerase